MSWLPPTSPAAALAEQCRAKLVTKLPASSLLPSSLLSSLSSGSDVRSIPETCGLLSPEQIRITRLDATELISDIAAGELTAVEVVTAFGIRTAIAQQLVCCLTDFWLEEALARARELDEHFAKTGKVVGALHGLPISLKDQVQITTKITSLGFLSVHNSAKPETSHAQLAQILQDAGAIFYCHTTLPQTIMHLECESFWGTTLNPCNTSLSSGGSSGGEGALIAMHGSPLGIGTDIGGSVRSPAGNCGLYGLRPTSCRVPNKGVKTYIPGRDSILGVVGPLAHSLRDVELFMKVVLESEPWLTEPALLELPWAEPGSGGRRGGKVERKLRVGVMWNDGIVNPVKPVERALREMVESLREKGKEEIELVEGFESWETRTGWELIRQLYSVDGGRRIRSLLDKNEDVQEALHPLSKWLLEESGPPLEDVTDIHRLWEINVAREKFRSEHNVHWNKSGIDVLLCPVAPQPASPHGTAKWWAYTSMFNLVDYPCIAFPTSTIVDQKLDNENDAERTTYKPLSEEDKYLHDLYKVEKYKDAPVCLQLVGRKYHDEEVLEALKKIEEVLSRP